MIRLFEVYQDQFAVGIRRDISQSVMSRKPLHKRAVPGGVELGADVNRDNRTRADRNLKFPTNLLGIWSRFENLVTSATREAATAIHVAFYGFKGYEAKCSYVLRTTSQ